MEFIVGMDEAFITAACFRLLMLASGGERNAISVRVTFVQSQKYTNVHI